MSGKGLGPAAFKIGWQAGSAVVGSLLKAIVLSVRYGIVVAVWLAPVVYRWLSGRPLDGRPRTDSTWLHAGTTAVTAAGQPYAGRPSRWAMLPGWCRQLWRHGVTAAAALSWWAYTVAPGLTVLGARVGASTLFAVVARSIRRRWRVRRFRRMYLLPLAAALAPLVGHGPHVRPERWIIVSPELPGLAARIAVPMSPAEVRIREWWGTYAEPAVRWMPELLMRTWWALAARITPCLRWTRVFRRPKGSSANTGPRIEVRFPEGAMPSAETMLAARRVVSAKLGLPELEEHWDHVGMGSVGIWTVRERPPGTVGLDAIAAYLDSLPESEFMVGLAAGERPVTVSLDDDSPHMACSAGSGAGKSVLAMLVATQVLRRGGRVVILDFKGSHRWARGLPGVTYCIDVAHMHEALIGIESEAMRRNRQALDEEDGWDPGQRTFIVAEELNATMAMLTNHWATIREKDDPKTSPAVQAFRNIMYTGRSAKTNLFAVAQMLTVQAVGGPAARENFGIRFLARFTANSWKMLVPEIAMPRRSRTRGRWEVCIGGVSTATQVAFMTSEEARRVATGEALEEPGVAPGRVPDGVPDTRCAADTSGTGTTGTRGNVDRIESVTLREAIDRGIISGPLETVRKRMARSTGADTPPVTGKLGKAHTYRIDHLTEWAKANAMEGAREGAGMGR